MSDERNLGMNTVNCARFITFVHVNKKNTGNVHSVILQGVFGRRDTNRIKLILKCMLQWDQIFLSIYSENLKSIDARKIIFS
jgi:hypothetical protein